MRVFVVGNTGVDETYVINEIPEKGASIHGQKINQDLGGKGANQAVILSRCAVSTVLIAATGNDNQGQWCRQQLAQELLKLFPEESLNCRTDTSLILNTADGDNSIITTTTAADALSLADIELALNNAQPGDVVLQQGNFSLEKTAAVFQLARRLSLRTVFNPSPVKPAFSQLWPLVDLLVVNRGEASYFTAPQLPPVEAASELLRAGASAVVVTLGADGVYFATADQQLHVTTPPCKVVDTTGAGDTFLAVMLASMLRRSVPFPQQLDLQRAARAAAITISRTGTFSAFPSQTELVEILNSPLA